MIIFYCFIPQRGKHLFLEDIKQLIISNLIKKTVLLVMHNIFLLYRKPFQ